MEHYLYDIAKADGTTLVIGNMYIGGCSLETHWNNAQTNAYVYSYRKINEQGKKTTTDNINLETAILDEDWDYITFQQVSYNSGRYNTYFPYLIHLKEYVQSLVTNSEVQYAIHMTWAYAQNSTHSGFANYNNNQMEMYEAIVDAVFRATQTTGISIVIPAGIAIQNGRTSFIGDNFCRDGFHLKDPIGRYTAACTWFETLTGKNVVGNRYISTLSADEVNVAQNSAHLAVLNPNTIDTVGTIIKEIKSRKINFSCVQIGNNVFCLYFTRQAFVH
ncbi:hypothetical protein AGMMS50262_24220 [Bacteroidia bacterium]|nr:hypothetical protein AGMMS50262_24220 [Bacteroidia bacterium]